MAISIKVANGDILVNSATGRPTTISGIDKLKQDLNEFFNVDIMPSGFGCGLDRLVGSLESGVAMVGLIDRYVTEGIEEFIQLQQADTSASRTADELLKAVDGIQISEYPNDPTKFYFRLNVITRGNTVFPYSKLLG